MLKSSLLSVSLLLAAGNAYAVNHAEAKAAMDGIDRYHTAALSCRAAVIKHNEAGMDKPPCVELLDGLMDLIAYSDTMGEYINKYQDTDPRLIPEGIMDRIPKAGSKASTIGDTINLLCGELNWCNR